MFDASRRASAKTWGKTDAEVAWGYLDDLNPVFGQGQIDAANDDGKNGFIDESETMVDGAFWYSQDAPGISTAKSGGMSPMQFFMKFNGFEFLRVRLANNDARPENGNKLYGSRMSNFFEWHSVMHLNDDADKNYQRVGGAAENKIGTGLITISNP